jgi:hypothetical protein
MCLAAAEKVLRPIICRLSSNNRPITDYLKNGRLIGFADYLPINRLIPTHQHHTQWQKSRWGGGWGQNFDLKECKWGGHQKF